MPKFFSGWLVVAAVFLVLMANAGLGFYGIAVYLDAITAEQALSTTVVSLATAMYFVISGVTGRVVAPLLERYDLRLIVAAGGVIAGVALWLLGQITNGTSLFLVYALMAVGVGMSGLVPMMTLVARWFHTRRSVALSIASTGLSFGGLTFARFASWLIERDDLRGAGPWLGGLYFVSITVALVALWPDPSARGEVPDGVSTRAGGVSGASGAPAVSQPGIEYEEAITTRFFHAVSLGFLLSMGSQVGAISQLAKLGTERVDTPTGALAVSTIAGTSVVARLIGGVVASRVPIMAMTTALAFIQGVSLFMLAFADTRTAIFVSALVFGATIGNLLMLQPLVIAEAFGLASYPRIFSRQQLIVTVGIALGPFLLGWLHDLVNYRLSFIVAGCISAAGGIALAQCGLWGPTPALIERQQVTARLS